jgi:serine/threonine protein kinase
MGVVYLATDPELRRLVAVKVLAGFNDNSEHGQDLRERFAREARAVAALNHNHIVGIHDVGVDEGRPFIVMQFLDGETMAEFIRRKPIVPAARKLKMLIELCNGLGYAHRNEIIHRDIKPANIMLTTEGGLKIMDFGLARLSADASTGLTRTGSLMGTQFYMSPEQWKGEPVDSRGDIFAVGVVMYELLTYHKPFTGEASHLVMLNILQMVPPPMRDIVPSLDPDLDWIVSKALEKDREQRYQSLQVMEADLQRVLDRTSGGDTDATVAMKRSEDPDRPSGSGSRKPRPPSSRIPNFEAISERRKAQIDAHLAAASEHLAGGRYAEAVEECEHVVILDVGEPQALEMLELAHRHIEDDRVRGWLEEIRADISRGALSQAEALIGETLRLRPDSADALGLQQQIRDRRREEERAAERARGFGLALSRARTQLADEAFDAAGRSISEVLAFDPAHPEALALRAQ